MEVAGHERQHSNLQSQRQHHQFPRAQRQSDSRNQYIFEGRGRTQRQTRGKPACRASQIDPELCGTGFVRHVSRYIAPTTECLCIWLDVALEPRCLAYFRSTGALIAELWMTVDWNDWRNGMWIEQ